MKELIENEIGITNEEGQNELDDLSIKDNEYSNEETESGIYEDNENEKEYDVEVSSEEDFDLDDAEQVETIPISKSIGEPGVITIINSKNNGKRVCIASEPMDILGNPEKIQVVLKPQGIVVGRRLPNTTKYFKVSKSGAKGVIYSYGLVEEITSKCNLEFSNGRVSLTFDKVIYKDTEDGKMAYFKLV